MFRFHTHYLILLIGLFSINLWASEKSFIISGFDDVLRQAENTGILNSAIKILENDKTFSGMPELYTVISSRESIPKFVIVSAISSWFDGRINNFLINSNFPPHRKYLRNWLTEWSIEDFKINRIKEIIKEWPGRRFIVIFDNSDASILLADKLHEQFSNQIQAIYLRQVIEKDIPKSATSFFTAFDIALAEFATGRMNPNEVEIVGHAILKVQEVSMIFPAYSICPKIYRPCGKASPAMLKFCENVQGHIESLCQRRDK